MTSGRAKAPPPGVLAITKQALKDLGFRGSSVADSVCRNPSELVNDHPVIADFVAKRSLSREGQETTLGIKPKTWNLHTKKWRSLTWYDDAEDVCWLLAANEKHDYNEFVSRFSVGTLFPTDVDRAELKKRLGLRDDFLDIAFGQVDDLLALARDKPETEHPLLLGEEIDMTLYREVLSGGRERLWLLYKVPPKGNKDLPAELAELLTALFFPDQLNVLWHSTEHPARPVGPGHDERVMRWTSA